MYYTVSLSLSLKLEPLLVLMSVDVYSKYIEGAFGLRVASKWIEN